ncbi:MAG: beta/gamma crystallin-related protein [Betaproteobacteria bacterium]
MKTKRLTMFVGLVTALASGAVIAVEMTLYENPRFSGRRITVRGAVNNFDRGGFNDRASSVSIRSGIWELCTDANYRGECRRLGPGEYEGLGRDLNDSISSVRPIGGYDDRPGPGYRPGPGPGYVPGPGNRPNRYPAGAGGGRGPMIELFERREFGGRSITLRNNTRNFEDIGFNDRADAAIVRGGVWRLCSDARQRGECREFGPGRYNDLGSLGGKVSSAALISR